MIRKFEAFLDRVEMFLARRAFASGPAPVETAAPVVDERQAKFKRLEQIINDVRARRR